MTLRYLLTTPLTQSGTPVLVSSGSIVYFEIQQSSNLPIHVDPTGKGDIGYSLNGNFARFSTVYSAGEYTPIIKVGDKTKTLQLIVNQEKADIGWLTFLSQASWPLSALLVFIALFTALCFWKELRDRILSINEVEIRGVKMRVSDFSSRATAALESTISTIERTLPGIPARFLPSSISFDIAYDVHILEFLDDIGAPPASANAWNAAGNYYFEHSLTKAESAYKRAIKQDKNHPDAYANLGILHLKKRDIYTAKRYFTMALELAEMPTTCAAAHMGMVVISSSEEDGMENERLHCEQAKDILQRAVLTDKADFWSLYFLGWCWSYGDRYGGQDLNKAIEYTSRALEYVHDFHGARYNLACFYALKNEPQKSIEVLKEINPTRQILINTFTFEEDPDWNKVASTQQFKQFCSFMGLSYQHKGTAVLEDNSGGPETERT